MLLVCVEKFSDKIGTVRPSRMIFGDGAAAMVIGPRRRRRRPATSRWCRPTRAARSARSTRSSGRTRQFDNDITVYGPEVKALVARYLVQMIDELHELPHPDDPELALVDAIDLVVPHQANRTMVVELAGQAGIAEDSLYFNIDRVGNVSAASIPIAIWDAVDEGVIDRRMRIFAPGFGAGAIAGYVVLWIDPAILVPEGEVAPATAGAEADDGRAHTTTVDDVREAFN